jgi:hypothetical protein
MLLLFSLMFTFIVVDAVIFAVVDDSKVVVSVSSGDGVDIVVDDS